MPARELLPQSTIQYITIQIIQTQIQTQSQVQIQIQSQMHIDEVPARELLTLAPGPDLRYNTNTQYNTISNTNTNTITSKNTNLNTNK